MVRTPKSHSHSHPEEEDDDAEDVAAGTDTSSHREGKSAEQKPSNPRSKHSETEQRRRSKINERFQILKDLIPPNDQKRDKASLLLEVIEYIHFLQEKLQVYEGSYQQVWGQEPTKLIPWRSNHGPVDNLANHSQAIRNGSMDEPGVAQPMTNMQSSVEPDFSGELAYRGTEHHTGHVMPAVSMNFPLHPCAYLPGRSVPPIENTISQHNLSSITECTVGGHESRTFEGGSSSSSGVYSQGLLKKLTLALQNSGVDLSQANISVDLDVGKRANSGSTAAPSTALDVDNELCGNQSGSHPGEFSAKEFVNAAKRPRTGES